MSQPHFNSQSIDDWLFYLQSCHPNAIELGLDRVRQVAANAELLKLGNARVVLVAGTNGKGTTIRFLEQYLLELGFQVGVYSSPHLIHYHERVRINGQCLPDSAHVESFKFIESKRETTSLTYFEFGTLAAFQLIKQANVDFALIEVGLGGRLDATNILDHELAIITSIGLDHVDYLGDDINGIAFEKAGIFRSGCHAVIGEPSWYDGFTEQQNRLAPKSIAQVNREFQYHVENNDWSFTTESLQLKHLIRPMIPVQNVATGIMSLLKLNVAVQIDILNRVLSKIGLPGRLQTLSSSPLQMVDVAHNGHAARYLAEQLKRLKQDNSIEKICAVVAMMGDKDISDALLQLKDIVDIWYVAEFNNNPRAAKALQIKNHLSAIDVTNVTTYPSVSEAWTEAKANQTNEALLLGFGSFYTVGEILELEGVESD